MRYSYARDLQYLYKIWPDVVAFNQVKGQDWSNTEGRGELQSQFRGYNRRGFIQQDMNITLPKQGCLTVVL